jgi:hypothetical protein
MLDRKTLAAAGALALAAGTLFVPQDTSARGAGFAAARGPMFGFHAHRALRPAVVHRSSARFLWHLHWWNLHRFAARNRAGASATYPLGDAGYAPGAGDETGTLAVPAPEPALLPAPAAPYPPEHVGCLSRGYDVSSESGGVAHVVVTRC